MKEKQPIISVNDVTMCYGGRTVLSDVNLMVDEGDFLAITGPNGGGKTTLLRIVLGLLKPTRGSVTYRIGDDVVERLDFGYLPQKNAIDSRFPVTVEEVVAMGLSVPPLRRMTADQHEAVDRVLDEVGLLDRRREAIGDLSGGQLQRALLARAIIAKPKVMVLDEPLSYVDKQFEQRLYDLIGRLAATTTILLVSHEMTTIAQMANRHLIINGGVHECEAHSHFVKTECR